MPKYKVKSGLWARKDGLKSSGSVVDCTEKVAESIQKYGVALEQLEDEEEQDPESELELAKKIAASDEYYAAQRFCLDHGVDLPDRTKETVMNALENYIEENE